MSIGFKEWAIVCDALARGDQSITLRKGGLHEGRDGFQFRHPEFFLFPTFFHEHAGRTRLPAGTPLPQPTPGQIAVRLWARAEWTRTLTDLATVQALLPFHVWQQAEIEQRFQYAETPGVHLAFLRVFRVEPIWTFPESPAFGGCRSWVDTARATTWPAAGPGDSATRNTPGGRRRCARCWGTNPEFRFWNGRKETPTEQKETATRLLN